MNLIPEKDYKALAAAVNKLGRINYGHAYGMSSAYQARQRAMSLCKRWVKEFDWTATCRIIR